MTSQPSSDQQTSRRRRRFAAAPMDLIIHGHRLSGLHEPVIANELSFAGRLDARRLARAAELLLDAEPVLGSRLVTRAKRAYWKAVPDAERHPFVLVASRAEYESFRDSGVEAVEGIQLAVCLWQDGATDRLIVKTSHESGDGGGSKDTLAHLAAIYSALAHDPDHLPVTNTGARDLTQVTRNVPLRAYPRILLDCLSQLKASAIPAETHLVPAPAGPMRPWTYVLRTVRPEQVAYLAAYSRQRGATLNDLLVAAFGRAAAASESWDGRSALRVWMTVDLRRWCKPAGQSQGIGNLSTAEMIRLADRPGLDFDQMLSFVAAQTRRMKQGWMGLSLSPFFALTALALRLFDYEKLSQPRDAKGKPSGSKSDCHVLSNVGRYEKSTLSFAGLFPSTVHMLAMATRPPLIFFLFSTYEDALTISVGAPVSGLAVIESFLDELLRQLPAPPVEARPATVGASEDARGA